MTFREFRSYSVVHDAIMVRLSVSDARGAEYFTLLPASSGKAYRRARDEALTAIEQAISMGLEPGMVRMAAQE